MISSLPRDELYYRHQLSHDQIDDILGEKRSGEFPESKAQHLCKINAFLKVTELFEKEGISFMPQKGPILSYRLFGDPLYRTFVDLDFFVAEDQIMPAVDLLLKNGCRTPFYTLPLKNCHRKLLFKHNNEIILLNDGWSVSVELHWSLHNCKILNEEDSHRILNENERSVFYEGRRFRVFSEELELLFLVVHGTLHGWSRLKWLLDVKVLLEKFEIDELRFAELVRQFSAGRPVAVCNELLKIYFPGTKLLPSKYKAPAGMVRFALKQISQPDRKKGIGEFLGFFRNSWRAFPGMEYKIDLLKRNLFATDLASASWMPCSPLVFYIVSPFWKLVRGFRG
jgi:hypothetical protein